MSSLPLITALARAGSLTQAWRLFREGGHDTRNNDPAALAVKGRLLKDSGLLLSGEDRARKLAEAAAAYAQAAAIDPQVYLRINVATLRLLSGDTDGALISARSILTTLAAPELIADTPYWIAATRAEALLILGENAQAAEALADARAASPGNWEDQATTVRQLSLILAARGQSTTWLDPHRPPRTLHFAGHMAVNPAAAGLSAQIGDWLTAENVGFGYGALAAGGDITIAEALLANGCELHVLLPVSRELFVEQSVRSFGEAWVRRYHACLDAAESVQEITRVTGSYEPLATSLSSDVTMGAAALQASRLQTEAVQLLIVDNDPAHAALGQATARDRGVWQLGGRRQHVINWPRIALPPTADVSSTGRADRRLLALVGLRIDGLAELDEGQFSSVLDHWLQRWWEDVSRIEVQPLHFQKRPSGAVFAFGSVVDARQFALALSRLSSPEGHPVAVAGHYGLLHELGGEVCGPALFRLDAMAGMALPGTVMVSSSFAMALAIQPGTQAFEQLGELDGTPLYALRANAQ